MKLTSLLACIAAAALVTTAACGSSSGTTSPGDTTITASSYDQSCQSAADCVAVAVGQACEACGLACPSDAINKNAQAKYEADVKRATSSCNPPPGGCGADCIAFTVTCTAGKCGGCPGMSCADAGGGDSGADSGGGDAGQGDGGRDAAGD